jgi:hypothetical protein
MERGAGVLSTTQRIYAFIQSAKTIDISRVDSDGNTADAGIAGFLALGVKITQRCRWSEV